MLKKKKTTTKSLQEMGGLEGAGHEALRETTNAAVDLYRGIFPSAKGRLQGLPQRTWRVPGSTCPGTVAAFSGFQLLRNMWKLHAVSQLNKPGGKMAESEKLGH